MESFTIIVAILFYLQLDMNIGKHYFSFVTNNN